MLWPGCPGVCKWPLKWTEENMEVARVSLNWDHVCETETFWFWADRRSFFHHSTVKKQGSMEIPETEVCEVNIYTVRLLFVWASADNTQLWWKSKLSVPVLTIALFYLHCCFVCLYVHYDKTSLFLPHRFESITASLCLPHVAGSRSEEHPADRSTVQKMVRLHL